MMVCGVCVCALSEIVMHSCLYGGMCVDANKDCVRV